MSRLFVGVRPPTEVRVALGALPRPEEPGVRWVPPAQWHVTLRFLGSADAGDVVAALGGADLPQAEAVLGPRVSRLGRSVVSLPVTGLDELAAAVTAATSHLGEPSERRDFNGHLTLARLRPRAACSVVGSRFAARFAVGEVELVSSVTDPTGAVHEVLARLRCTDVGNAGPNTRS